MVREIAPVLHVSEPQPWFPCSQEYLKSDPSERSHELNLIFTVKQGDEPDSFKSLFPSWDPAHWEDQVRISAIWAALTTNRTV
uniref:Uncharacterized protein n=1 Tax=Timema tahoe TaxID=61484 RepID=A0A7R9FIN3_9NEOP|nr:unnamed protein product [Timema tahoe]